MEDKHGDRRPGWNDNSVKVYCEHCAEWIKYDLDQEMTNTCKKCGNTI